MIDLPAELLSELTRKARGLPHGNQNTKKTACVHGHEFTSENTKLYRGRRLCRVCLRKKRARQKRAARLRAIMGRR
jgi:hypothetical protein